MSINDGGIYVGYKKKVIINGDGPCLSSLNTLYMENKKQDPTSTRTVKPAKKLTPILVTIPDDWIRELDVIADFYCKNRMVFLRDFIQEGIKRTAEKYRSDIERASDMNQIFDEMSEKSAQFKEKKEANKSGW